MLLLVAYMHMAHDHGTHTWGVIMVMMTTLQRATASMPSLMVCRLCHQVFIYAVCTADGTTTIMHICQKIGTRPLARGSSSAARLAHFH